MAKNKVYTVRLEYETLVSAESEEQAKEIVSTHQANFQPLFNSEDEQKPIVMQEDCKMYVSNTSYLPKGWNMKCAPHTVISAETFDFDELDVADSPMTLEELSEKGCCEHLFSEYAVDGE